MRVLNRFWVLVAMALAGFAGSALAKEAPVYTAKFANVAVSGYDPVAYFTDGKPVKGSASISATHQGVKWYFANTTNRDTFLAAPEQYAPQYGGYCAWAVSQGYTASADPTAWKIVGNKLFLNYNAQVQRNWEKSIPELIRKADGHWPKVLD